MPLKKMGKPENVTYLNNGEDLLIVDDIARVSRSKVTEKINIQAGGVKVFLSNAPAFILGEELKSNSLKRWMYFGTNDSILRKLERLFSNKAEQVHYGKELYEITKAKRNEYIAWIDQIAAYLLDRKEWLFSVPSVKNTYMSHIFLYSCYLFLLEDFIREKKHVDLIFVDSPALANLFKDNFPDSIKLAPVNKWLKLSSYLQIFSKLILRMGKYLIEFGRKFIAAKVVLKNRHQQLLSEKKNFVLIRNFIIGDSGAPDDFIEKHYFPGLYDYLEKRGCAPVFFPIISKASHYRQLYRKVLESKKTIIFPEEFLKPQDYLYTFFAPLRALNLNFAAPPYGRYRLGRLLKEEYYANLTEHGFLYATLLSCVGKRFKESNFVPLGMINWMENQALEKGLIKGFKENFSNMKIIGSQPFFIQDNYLAPVPAYQEKRSGLLPEKILVLGPAGREVIAQFINDVQISYSPPFRYTSLISEKPANGQGNNLLVLSEIDFKNAIRIIQMLLKIEPHLQSFDRIMIKLHPAANFDQRKLIKALGQSLPDRFEFVHGTIEEYIQKTAIGFCAGATSTAAQLVMMGIPVIILGEPYALSLNLLSCKEDLDMWQLCFSSEEIAIALNHFTTLRKENPQNFAQKAQEFRDYFIAPRDERYWKNYCEEWHKKF